MSSKTTRDSSTPADPEAVLDAILDIVSEEEPESEDEREAERQWADQLVAKTRMRLTELRRQLSPDYAALPANVISPEIQALDREAILARIESLRQGGDVRYAHLESGPATDEDLRQLLATLVAPTER